MLEVFYGVIFTILGLLVGSFLNVCIYRIPHRNFFSEARSFCPNCGKQLKWYDNIPVLSYIILKGKCRFCEGRISFRYPFVEIFNMLLFLASYLMWGISVATVLNAVLLSTLLVISAIDFDYQDIPNGSCLFILILALVGFIPGVQNIIWYEKLIGFVVISVPFFLLALLTNGGIGGGDIKLMAVAGLFLGYKLTLLATLFGVVCAGVGGIALMIVKKKGGKYHMPLGPFLAIGIGIALFFGDIILKWYTGLLA